ncbi:MAG: site-specific integrase [Acidobacteriota bacterium]|nr:site-specific integrase [Acidobacteriota bacterium]
MFEAFIRERRYLRNLSEETITFYQDVYRVFKVAEPFTQTSLEEVIIKMRERGVSVGGVNTYIRGINVYLRWLHTQGAPLIVLRKLKEEKKVFRSLTDSELRAIVSFKPKSKTEKRLYALLLTLIDTGIRINEALTLERGKVDFDNLLLTVKGKGNKERVVPFSYELRKVLFKQLNHKFNLVFCNRDGGKLRYDNIRRDFNSLMERLGIKPDAAFHAFRRTFATNYIKNGGNPLVLQRLLGHTTLHQTNQYVKLVTDDLAREQQRTSILSRLK